MEVLTAIEFFKETSLKRRKKENKYIRDIIISQSNFYLTEDDFILGYLEETDICINIDEKYFKVDGMDFTDWCKSHFIVLSESDKTIRIDGFKF